MANSRLLYQVVNLTILFYSDGLLSGAESVFTK